MKNPIQPLIDVNGVLRFKKNKIVEYLLDNGGIDLNDIAEIGFSDDDRMQFAQLIGYSLSGYGDLSYVSDINYNTAYMMKSDDSVTETQARIEILEDMVKDLKCTLKEPIARLYGIHPDDLYVER